MSRIGLQTFNLLVSSHDLSNFRICWACSHDGDWQELRGYKKHDSWKLNLGVHNGCVGTHRGLWL